jgi:hypothetical protein
MMACPFEFDFQPFFDAFESRKDGSTQSNLERIGKGVATFIEFYQALYLCTLPGSPTPIIVSDTCSDTLRNIAVHRSWNFWSLNDSWSTFSFAGGSNRRNHGIMGIKSAFESGILGRTNSTAIIGEPRVGKTVTLLVACIYSILCGNVPILLCGVPFEDSLLEVYAQFKDFIDVFFRASGRESRIRVINVVSSKRQLDTFLGDDDDNDEWACLLIARYQKGDLDAIMKTLDRNPFDYWLVMDESDLIDDDTISKPESQRYELIRKMKEIHMSSHDVAVSATPETSQLVKHPCSSIILRVDTSKDYHVDSLSLEHVSVVEKIHMDAKTSFNKNSHVVFNRVVDGNGLCKTISRFMESCENDDGTFKRNAYGLVSLSQKSGGNIGIGAISCLVQEVWKRLYDRGMTMETGEGRTRLIGPVVLGFTGRQIIIARGDVLLNAIQGEPSNVTVVTIDKDKRIGTLIEYLRKVPPEHPIIVINSQIGTRSIRYAVDNGMGTIVRTLTFISTFFTNPGHAVQLIGRAFGRSLAHILVSNGFVDADGKPVITVVCKHDVVDLKDSCNGQVVKDRAALNHVRGVDDRLPVDQHELDMIQNAMGTRTHGKQMKKNVAHQVEVMDSATKRAKMDDAYRVIARPPIPATSVVSETTPMPDLSMAGVDNEVCY